MNFNNQIRVIRLIATSFMSVTVRVSICLNMFKDEDQIYVSLKHITVSV